MTTKPDLVGSLIVMAFALALGLISSLLVSRRRRDPQQDMAAQKAQDQTSAG
jgi:hypothetical protein